MSHIILGIDPSRTNTGLVVLDTSTFSVLYQGTLRNPPGGESTDMLPYKRIYAAVAATISTCHPTMAFAEKMFNSKFGNVAELLFVAAYSARLAAYDAGIPCHVVPITGRNKGWYHYILGDTYSSMKGGLGKVNARVAVEAALGVEFKNEHIADAASIALAGYFYQTGIDFRDVLKLDKPVMDGSGVIKKPKKKKPTKKELAIQALQTQAALDAAS